MAIGLSFNTYLVYISKKKKNIEGWMFFEQLKVVGDRRVALGFSIEVEILTLSEWFL